jgi:hypothetical protein
MNRHQSWLWSFWLFPPVSHPLLALSLRPLPPARSPPPKPTLLAVMRTATSSAPLRRSTSRSRPVVILSVSISNAPKVQFANECPTHNWNKYCDTIIAPGGVDTFVRAFDTQSPRQPLSILRGHKYAVRKLAWSPPSAIS